MSVVLITDPRYSLARTREVITLAAKVLPDLVVQLRDKANVDLIPTAQALRDLTRSVGARFVVNGSLEVARVVDADGVHVPLEVIASARGFGWISTPAHADADVSVAEEAGATAVFVSPIFQTPGKGEARGVSAITRAVELRKKILVYALGGIDGTNVGGCKAADGVAVIRALLDASDPAAEAARLDAPFRAV